MAVFRQPTVLVYGDKRLKETAKPVEDPSSCAELIEKMRRVLIECGGVGLAATQIGEMRRVLIWKIKDSEGCLINPVLQLGDEKEIGIEGCLSVPGMAGDVSRSAFLKASGFDEKGDPVSFQAEGLLARVLQHEVDHLDGILFLDRLEPGTLRPAPMTAIVGI